MPMAFSGPAGFITAPTEVDTLDMKNNGFQSRSCTLRIAWAANFGRRRHQQHVGAGALQTGDLAIDGRIGGLIAGG